MPGGSGITSDNWAKKQKILGYECGNVLEVMSNLYDINNIRQDCENTTKLQISNM